MVVHKAACHTLQQVFFLISEDMVQILLILEDLFTLNSKVEDLFCDAHSGCERSLFKIGIAYIYAALYSNVVLFGSHPGHLSSIPGWRHINFLSVPDK